MEGNLEREKRERGLGKRIKGGGGRPIKVDPHRRVAATTPASHCKVVVAGVGHKMHTTAQPRAAESLLPSGCGRGMHATVWARASSSFFF